MKTRNIDDMQEGNVRLHFGASWQQFRDQSAEDAILTKLVYEESEELIRSIAEQLPSKYELIFFTDYLEDTKMHEYRCAVFIDRENKQVVCANAGTRAGLNAKGFSDIRDDLKIVIGSNPKKFESVKELNDTILQNIPAEEFADYKFHYTGHSLGAVIADLSAADMALRLRDKDISIQKPPAHIINGGDRLEQGKVSSTTFDNPGAKKLVEKLYQEYEKKHPEKKISKNNYKNDISYVAFNNRQNIINTAAEPAGDVYEIKPDGQDEKRGVGSIIMGFLAKVLKPVIPILAKVCKWFSYGTISKQIAEHKLDNFENVLVNRRGKLLASDGALISMEEALTGKEPIVYDQKVFENLQTLKVEQNGAEIGAQKFKMIKRDDQGMEVDSISFSFAELRYAASRASSRESHAERMQLERSEANKQKTASLPRSVGDVLRSRGVGIASW